MFGHTLREAPAEAETASHRLLLRAGFIDQLMAGVYSYLPLGRRTKLKVEQVVREEMDGAGGQEVLLPAIQPIELWQQSGRDELFGSIMFLMQLGLRQFDNYEYYGQYPLLYVESGIVGFALPWILFWAWIKFSGKK